MQVTYADKVTGGDFTAADANELKNAINENEIKKAVFIYEAADIQAKTSRIVIPAPETGEYIEIIKATKITVYKTTVSENAESILLYYGTSTSNTTYYQWTSGYNFTHDFTSIVITNNMTGGNATLESLPVSVLNQSDGVTGDNEIKLIIFYTIETLE